MAEIMYSSFSVTSILIWHNRKQEETGATQPAKDIKEEPSQTTPRMSRQTPKSVFQFPTTPAQTNETENQRNTENANPMNPPAFVKRDSLSNMGFTCKFTPNNFDSKLLFHRLLSENDSWPITCKSSTSFPKQI